MTTSLPQTQRGIGFNPSHTDRKTIVEVITVDVPQQPEADEVLVHVYASSLNPTDWKLALSGVSRVSTPKVLGRDISGVVTKIGSSVQHVKVGDAVVAYGSVRWGGGWFITGDKQQSGYVIVHRDLTAIKPDNVSHHIAASLPIAYLSAYDALKPTLKAGDTVFIPGATGGVGQFGVQVARALGASQVVGSVGTEEKKQIALKLGYDHVINYREQKDITAAVKNALDGKLPDVVAEFTYLDSSFIQSAQTVREGGKLAVLYHVDIDLSASQGDQTLGSILKSRNVDLHRADLSRYSTDQQYMPKRPVLRGGLEQAMAWIADGKLKPLISKTIGCTIDEVERELQRMSKGEGEPGKVVVTVLKQ